MKNIVKNVFLFIFITSCNSKEIENVNLKKNCKIIGPVSHLYGENVYSNYVFYYDCVYFNNYIDYIHLGGTDTIVNLKCNRLEKLLNFYACGDYTNYQNIFVYKDTLTAIKIDITTTNLNIEKRFDIVSLKKYYENTKKYYDTDTLQNKFKKTLSYIVWEKDSNLYAFFDYINTVNGVRTFNAEIRQNNNSYKMRIEYASKINHGTEIMDKRKFALGILNNIYVERQDTIK